VRPRILPLILNEFVSEVSERLKPPVMAVAPTEMSSQIALRVVGGPGVGGVTGVTGVTGVGEGDTSGVTM